MSKDMRRSIMYWFTLLFGIAVLILQLYKYYKNELGSWESEAGIFAAAVILLLRPNTISDIFLTIMNSKFGNKNE